MPKYHIDEMDGETIKASHVANGSTALDALNKITGVDVSPRALHQHWFRVVDEGEGSVFEYGLGDSAPAPPGGVE